MVGVPRVAAGAEAGAFGRTGDAEFGRVGLAEDVDAGGLEALHEKAVEIVPLVLVEACAVRARHAGNFEAQILDQEGHAFERTVGQVFRVGARGVIGLVHYRVEFAVVAFGALDRGFDEFGG